MRICRTRKNLDGLTPREQETLQFLADGLRYKEIADRMHIGLDTVRKHVQSIYVKFHVKSRTEAVVKYLRCWLHNPPKMPYDSRHRE